MAAPDSVTMTNISGSYTMSKPLSDDAGPMLSLQGVGFLLRNAMKIGTLTLNVTHTRPDGVDTLATTAVPMGGFKGNTSERKLNGEVVPQKDFMFGECEITPSVKKVGEIEDEWLMEGWVEDVVFDEVVVNKKDGWKNHNVSLVPSFTLGVL